MQNILIAIHLIITIAIVVFVLLQKSEGGALGIGGKGDGLVSSRGAADFLSKTTTILAALFFATSLGLAWLAQDRLIDRRLLDNAGSVEIPSGGIEAPITPIAPLQPIVPENPAPALPLAPQVGPTDTTGQ